jgi:radical SAM enzyme (rSAM/lipoprotein system)
MHLGFKKFLALEAHRLYRHSQIKSHPLTYLFWECTLRCNLHCLHCGSDCVVDAIPDMPREDFMRVLDGIAPHIDPNNFIVVITGGEPLMRADLEEIGKDIKARGYPWGMVTNALALTPERYTKLLNAGLRALTISLDGLEENHNHFRGNPHSFERAVRSINMAAHTDGITFDVMTCVNRKNLKELPKIFNLLLNLGVKRWRVSSVFQKGRAKDNPLFQLTNDEFRQIFEFIREAKQKNLMSVNYDCEGFLGSYEKVARDTPFFCWAGVNIASVLCDGSISACPSLRGDFIQGNIYKDDLWDVWQNRYQVMRDRKWARIGECKDCKYWRYCEGSSLHLRDERTKELAYCHVKRLEAAGV